MIIYGTRGVTTTPDTGAFHCPRCGPETAFKQKRVRRFFTLYFIPVIPLGALGEYVECQQCRNTYDVEVLKYDPNAGAEEFRAQFEQAVQQVMILMTLADGVVDDAEIAAMASIFQQLSGRVIAEEDLRREVDAAARDPRPVDDYLKEFGALLNNESKEIVIKAMFLIAATDGDFDESEIKLLTEAAEAMEMSKAHLNGIIAEMTSGE